MNEYQKMEEEHVRKLEQAKALIEEVLSGEKSEVENPKPMGESLREELSKNFK